MAKDRLALHEKLLATLGSTQVYYNTPPSTVKLEYPCIIYKLDDVAGVSANNKKYWGTRRYLIRIVDRKTFEDGSLYIADADAVEELGLTEDYQKL